MNPVEYAEKVLGIHTVYEEAQQRLDQHEASMQRIRELKNDLRNYRNQRTDKEMELVTLAPQMWPHDSATARKEKLKLHMANDPDLRELDHKIDVCKFELDSAESEARHHELGLNVLSARMNQLGGVMHYYAEVKREITETTIQPQGGDQAT